MAESDSEDSELADLELENPNQFLGTPLSILPINNPGLKINFKFHSKFHGFFISSIPWLRKSRISGNCSNCVIDTVVLSTWRDYFCKFFCTQLVFGPVNK